MIDPSSQIERATLFDLDWALAHMDAKKQKAKQTNGASAWVYEAEKKGVKEDVSCAIIDVQHKVISYPGRFTRTWCIAPR